MSRDEAISASAIRLCCVLGDMLGRSCREYARYSAMLRQEFDLPLPFFLSFFLPFFLGTRPVLALASVRAIREGRGEERGAREGQALYRGVVGCSAETVVECHSKD